MSIKKLTTLFIFFIILFSFSCAFASEDIGDTDTVKIYFNGEEISFRVAPQFQNGRLVVPVRPFLEALGAKIDWDRERGSVITALEDKTIVLHVNDAMIEINGDVIEVDTPAVIVAGTTMLPLRIVSELFGLQVNWDSEKGVVEVESKNYVPFRQLKGSDDLSLPVLQWVETSRQELINTSMELDNQLYILSSLGWKPTGGYDVKVRRIVWKDSAWLVTVESKEPLPGQPTIQVISNPYDLVCVDLSIVARPTTIVYHTVFR